MPYVIDRYILRQYVKSFVICLLSMTGLFVIVDAFSHLDEFIEYAEKTGESVFAVVGDFYLYRSLAFFDRISAVLAMISAMFTITWFQRHNELTALMAAGISRIRAARPVIAAAVVITLLAMVMRELILPAFREKLVGEARDLLGSEAQPMRARLDHETQVFLRGDHLRMQDNCIHRPNFVLPPGLDVEGINLSAVDAFYMPKQADRPAGYLFKSVTSPAGLLKHPTIERGGKPALYTPVDHPEFLAADEVFLVSNVELEQLKEGSSYRQYLSLVELIRGLRNPSLDYGADVRVAIHSRIVQPFRDVTLLFLGLPLVLRRETKNVYAAVGLCAGLTILFLLFVTACEYLGGVLLIRPSLAAWLPLMVFVPTAVLLFDQVDR